MTKEDLDKVLENHKLWIHGKEGGQRANLSGENIRCVNFSDVNLRCADLRDANLKGANLKGVDLRDVDLRGADLKGAYLEDTYLGGAYLKGADLNKTYYQITRIGSRNATTTYCVEDDNVVCGCWNNYRGGTLEEFKKRVESVYGKDGKTPDKKYYTQYTAAIKFFEKMVKLAKMEEE